jgi:uncharacterized protein Yka (UPF0111/DUF47 family)
MNELERMAECARVMHNALAVAQRYKLAKVSIPIETAEEMLDMINDSLRTIKDYQVFDHTLPLPPKKLGVKSK